MDVKLHDGVRLDAIEFPQKPTGCSCGNCIRPAIVIDDPDELYNIVV